MNLHEAGSPSWAESWRSPFRRWPYLVNRGFPNASADAAVATAAVGSPRAACVPSLLGRGVDGRETTPAGISDLRFGPDGLVIWQRDYWNSAEDTATPPPGDWGPAAAHEGGA